MDKQAAWEKSVELAFGWVTAPSRMAERAENLGNLAAVARDIYTLMQNPPPDATGTEYDWAGGTGE